MCANTNLIALSNDCSGLSDTLRLAEAVFAARTGTIQISEFPRNMASDSEVSGVDVTATAVHDALSQGQSMQVDDFSGVDIPSDTQENQEGRDIQGYLESLNRSPTTEISSSSDAEIPEPPDAETKVTGRTPHMGPQWKKQPRQWTGCIWAVHWKLCLHRMM